MQNENHYLVAFCILNADFCLDYSLLSLNQ
jgi:hypothetical protein